MSKGIKKLLYSNLHCFQLRKDKDLPQGQMQITDRPIRAVLRPKICLETL